MINLDFFFLPLSVVFFFLFLFILFYLFISIEVSSMVSIVSSVYCLFVLGLVIILNMICYNYQLYVLKEKRFIVKHFVTVYCHMLYTLGFFIVVVGQVSSVIIIT